MTKVYLIFLNEYDTCAIRYATLDENKAKEKLYEFNLEPNKNHDDAPKYTLDSSVELDKDFGDQD